MTQLNTLPGIGESSLELLEAAGFADLESLANARVDELATELERANKILRIAKTPPERNHVADWISSARELTGVGGEPEEMRAEPVNYENSADVVTMLAAAPFAIPLPAKVLVEQQLGVGDIPPAILLNRYSGDLQVRGDDRTSASKPVRPAVTSGNVRSAELGEGPKMDMDSSRIMGTETRTSTGTRTLASKSSSNGTEQNERVALIRAPRVETNKGKDPKSRRYIRGVLHSHPFSLAVGAVVTLLLGLLLPVAIISAGLLLLSREVPEHFSWVPQWLLAFPMALPVVGVSYLIWGLNGSCRICGQRQFVPRMCLKNSKAHHFPGLGYIVPVALHMLFFRWFRCTYCGTPVRLKK